MQYQHIVVPEQGEAIRVGAQHALTVPDRPIVPFIEGDGIGVDVTPVMRKVVDAAVAKAYRDKRRIEWMEVYAGEKAARVYGAGQYFPEETLDALARFIVSIKGPLATPIGAGIRSLNVTIRQRLDLYACVRPVRYFEGVETPMKNPGKMDIVIFRENTEDVYAGIEYAAGTPENEKLARFLREEMGAEFFEGSGLGIKPISAFGTKRLMRAALRFAIERGRKSITIVHKGNIQKYTEGAFRNWCYEVAREEFGEQTITEDELWDQYNGHQPEGKIVIKDRIADIMFQHMLLRPSEFDVVISPNLNGDYLSDAIAAEVGGVGIAPGANIGDNVALFEATHGTAPKYTDLDKVNPGSLMFSGVMMLEWLGWWEAAEMISRAYEKTLEQKIVTYDFARQMTNATEVGTSAFATALIRNLGE